MHLKKLLMQVTGSTLPNMRTYLWRIHGGDCADEDALTQGEEPQADEVGGPLPPEVLRDAHGQDHHEGARESAPEGPGVGKHKAL